MPETTSLFALSPSGLSGMVKLGLHLDALKGKGTIADWHPGRWETYKKERTGIRFDSAEDAAIAAKSWAAYAAGEVPAPSQESAAASAGGAKASLALIPS
jgi:hypothetical protein